MKGISKLLCKSQNTAEVQSDDANDDDDATGVAALYANDVIIHHVTFDPVATTQHFDNKVSVIIRGTETLPSVYLAEIPAPPPDLI